MPCSAAGVRVGWAVPLACGTLPAGVVSDAILTLHAPDGGRLLCDYRHCFWKALHSHAYVVHMVCSHVTPLPPHLRPEELRPR